MKVFLLAVSLLSITQFANADEVILNQKIIEISNCIKFKRTLIFTVKSEVIAIEFQGRNHIVGGVTLYGENAKKVTEVRTKTYGFRDNLIGEGLEKEKACNHVREEVLNNME